MRIISIKTLRDFWKRYRDAEKPLKDWFGTTEAAQWQTFMDVRQTFGSADTAVVASGNTVTIFDIGGNKYRLIAAIHYNTATVYAMMVLTHKEYDTNKWKAQL
ncbi:MAG: type II toxin-antitoxin system HigB family toxin [Alphaproteobacteria bacterium]|nr:type II toxin-antitoxin system HigB family toxin [Alphaproteobacteria bacterium]